MNKIPEWINKTIHVSQCWLYIMSTLWCHPVVCVAGLTYYVLYQRSEERNLITLQNRLDATFEELSEGLIGVVLGIVTILIWEVVAC